MKIAKYTLLVAVLGGCATLGNVTSTDEALPAAGVGPFRKLSQSEELGLPPYVLDDKASMYREPAALALDPADETGASPSVRVALYLVVRSKTGADVIARTHADDARSFYGAALDFGHSPVQVLAADQAWEGADLAGPSALANGGAIYLYYAGSGGIGVATSTDGFTFTKQSGPILAPDASATWETAVPHAPSVAILPSGEFRMLYGAGTCIGEATSTDGVHFTRIGTSPLLCPSTTPPPPVADGATPTPTDLGGVDDPVLTPRLTPAGRLQYRVLYTEYSAPVGDPSRSSAIGYAARYGDSGPLVKNAAPVYAVGKNERAPAFFQWQTGSMLY
ncbi:MAG TPA: hypothetical protein VF407_06500, partial [Polyangiaceae bacterium]